ncbi:MAG: hypothetical protein GTN99_02845 [Candidatus Dadabacteria bacterium]|nr:hypothetical protein [Candidatus Dadabacteria bacterium]
MSPSYIDLRGLSRNDKIDVVFSFFAMNEVYEALVHDWLDDQGVIVIEDEDYMTQKQWFDAYNEIAMIFIYDEQDIFVSCDDEAAAEHLEEANRQQELNGNPPFKDNSLIYSLGLSPSKGGLISTKPSEVLSMSIDSKLIERPIHLSGRDITIMNVDSLVNEIKQLKEFRKELTELELAESCPKIKGKIDEVNEAIDLCVAQINKD